jgi:hypothetical protein
MTDDANTAERHVIRLTELLAELRGLLSAGPEIVPPPVIFAVGDALEGVEDALRAIGPVGTAPPHEAKPPKSSTEARRRIDAVCTALLALASSGPVATRYELAAAVGELARWRHPRDLDEAGQIWTAPRERP